MFGFLIAAVFFKALTNRNDERGYVRWYWFVGGAMVLGAIVIQFGGMFGRHTTFVLEAYEIGLFALYWAVQTRENWNEVVVGSARPGNAAAGGALQDAPPVNRP